MWRGKPKQKFLCNTTPAIGHSSIGFNMVENDVPKCMSAVAVTVENNLETIFQENFSFSFTKMYVCVHILPRTTFPINIYFDLKTTVLSYHVSWSVCTCSIQKLTSIFQGKFFWKDIFPGNKVGYNLQEREREREEDVHVNEDNSSLLSWICHG